MTNTRRFAGLWLALGMLTMTGCIAVSGKKISTASRYDAVVLNGEIYVVDKQEGKAKQVTHLAGDLNLQWSDDD